MKQRFAAMAFASICLAWSPKGYPQKADPRIGESEPPDTSTKKSEESKIEEANEGEVIVITPFHAHNRSPSTREVGQDTLDLTPHRSADDLLRVVPGLHIAQHASEGKAQQFFLRGFDAIHGSDIAVSTAGVPINEPSNVHGHGYVDIGFLIPETVRSVSATKGSFAVSQGDFATAGSVDLELGVEESRRGQLLSYELGSTKRHRVLALVAPKYLSESSFLALEGVADSGFGEDRSSERITMLAQHRIPLSPNRWWQLLAAAYAARFDEPGLVPFSDVKEGALDFYDSYNDQGEGASLRGILALRYHQESTEHVLDIGGYTQWRRLRLAENFTGYLVNPDFGDLKEQRHLALSVGGSARYQYRLKSWAQLVFFSEMRGDDIAQVEDQVDDSGNVWRTNRDLAAKLLSGGVGTALRLSLGGLRADLGLRLHGLWMRGQDSQLNSEPRSEALFTAAPRFSLGYRISPQWRAFAAYGHGLRSPEARTLAVSDGSSARFTTARSTELGTEFYPWKWGSIGMSAFGVWIENELVFDHVSGLNLARNATRRIGVEAYVAANPTPWLSLRSDATAVSAKFVESGNYVPRAPRLLARAEAQLRLSSGLRAGAQVAFMGPRPLSHGAEGAGYVVLDLIGGYRIGSVDLEMQIDNLFNSEWREGEFHYASHFNKEETISQLPRLHYSAGRPLGIRVGMTMQF